MAKRRSFKSIFPDGVKVCVVAWEDHFEMEGEVSKEEAGGNMLFCSAGVLLEDTLEHVKLFRDIRADTQKMGGLLTVLKPTIVAKKIIKIK